MSDTACPYCGNKMTVGAEMAGSQVCTFALCVICSSRGPKQTVGVSDFGREMALRAAMERVNTIEKVTTDVIENDLALIRQRLKPR